jgi:uncharacterized membrane protein (DUF2068 family)
MRRSRRPWVHPETFVCAFKRHVTPAAGVARLRPGDAGVGVDLADGRRFSRCLRCDVWVAGPPPEGPIAQTLPPLEELPLPRRGEPLREALIMRLIAIDRAVHSVLFGLLAALLIYLDVRFAALRSQAEAVLRGVQAALGDTGQAASQSFVVRELTRFGRLLRGTVTILAGTAVIFCVVEGIEAVGLWWERRWAEYLTAVATAGFLPFEIDALVKRVTVLRLVGLVVNVAILVFLVWKKRLFGIRGGPRPAEAVDRQALFGPPVGARRAAPAETGNPPVGDGLTRSAG